MESDYSCLSVISFNMHGFYQGFLAIEHLAKSDTPPDILLLLEHWLTSANMDKFHTDFSSERELAFTIAICYRPSVCLLSVCCL